MHPHLHKTFVRVVCVVCVARVVRVVRVVRAVRAVHAAGCGLARPAIPALPGRQARPPPFCPAGPLRRVRRRGALLRAQRGVHVGGIRPLHVRVVAQPQPLVCLRLGRVQQALHFGLLAHAAARGGLAAGDHVRGGALPRLAQHRVQLRAEALLALHLLAQTRALARVLALQPRLHVDVGSLVPLQQPVQVLVLRTQPVVHALDLPEHAVLRAARARPGARHRERRYGQPARREH
jgi:hypothetical protein